MKKILVFCILSLAVPYLAWGQSSEPFVFHSGATADGDGSVMNASYYSTIVVQIEGTFTGEIFFEKKTKDATGWVAVQCTNAADRTVSDTSATAVGYWECPGGAYSFRARADWTSGTIVVTGHGSIAVSRSSGGGGGGSGTVTSVDASGGVETASGSAITGSGTIRGATCIKHEVGTTYTVLTGDRGCLVTFTNADPVAVTLPEAGSAGFEEQWYFYPVNLGAGTVTITPTTSTIQGAADIDLTTGKGAHIVSDGTNYFYNPGLGLTAETQSLDDVCTVDCEITTAVSEATGQKTGDGTNKMSCYWDPTGGWTCKPSPLGDSLWRIWTDFDGCVYDEEAAAKMFCYNPDAASSNLMYQYQTGYKAKASFMLPLNPRGAATGAYESIVTNQPTDYYITVTDANTDAADFTFVVPARYAGATTVTFRLSGVSKNATPSGNIDLDCAMSAFTPGTDTYTAHVTTGEVTALLTPATQNRPVAVTTSAHTINGGALVAGDVVYGSCEVDATATTSAQMSDFRLKGWILLTLDVNSPSD